MEAITFCLSGVPFVPIFVCQFEVNVLYCPLLIACALSSL